MQYLAMLNVAIVGSFCSLRSGVLIQTAAGQPKMNQEKLKQLQQQVRIGGKGTARRKKKVVHRTATTDDK